MLFRHFGGVKFGSNHVLGILIASWLQQCCVKDPESADTNLCQSFALSLNFVEHPPPVSNSTFKIKQNACTCMNYFG